MILFCSCIGADPFGLSLGYVNKDEGLFGVEFLTYLSNKTFSLTSYNTTQDATQAVRNINSWGFILLEESFSEDLISRFLHPDTFNASMLNGSSVHLHLDQSDQQISLTIQDKVLQSFLSFGKHKLDSYGLDTNLLSLPVIIETPIYGDMHPTFTNFMAPGIIITIVYFLASGLTALSFVIEKKEGLLGRSLVAGVSAPEILLAHILTQLMVMLVQVGILLVFALLVFRILAHGPVIYVIILALFQGFTGMALGFLVSALCELETNAIQLTLGLVYPTLMLSGVIWPIQGMPTWLGYISRGLPLTMPVEAMRSILSRGLDITQYPVGLGFGVSLAWGMIFLFLTMVTMGVKGL